MTLALQRDYPAAGRTTVVSARESVPRVVQLLLVAQMLGTIADFSTVSLAPDEGFDTARWALLLPGIAFTYFLLFRSRSLWRWISRGPALIFSLWLVWAMLGTTWSIDARQTAIQMQGAISLFVFSFWYVKVAGLNRYAQLFCFVSLVVILGGFLLDYGPWTIEPSIGPELERLADPDAPRRVYGLTNGTNQLSMLGGLTAIMATTIEPGDYKQRALQVASVTIGASAIVLSGSRTVMVALMIAFMVRFGWKATTQTRARVLAVGVGLALTLVGLLNFLSVETTFGAERSFESLNGRDEVWTYAQELIERSPFAGLGMTASRISWRQAFIEARMEFFAADSHNMVLEVLIGTGFIGLALFIAALAWATRRAFQSLDTTAAAVLTLILLASMTEALLSAATIHYSILGMCMACVTTDRYRATTVDP